MIQEILNQTEPAGNASWMSGKLLAVVASMAISLVAAVVAVAILIPDIATQIAMVVAGLIGTLIALIGVFVLLYNFFKILGELGIR